MLGGPDVKGYEALPELLRTSGCSTVFAMLGGGNVPWLAQGVSTGAIRLVKTRHEETAVSAAAGFAKASGQVGVCTVTRGPGFANSVNALTSAGRSHFPLLLFVGESPTSREGTSQQIDQRALTVATGAGFHHVGDVADLEAAFWSALRTAEHLGVPQVVSLADGWLESVAPDLSQRPSALAAPKPEPAAVDACVDALAGSVRPLILVGQGAVLADCRSDIEHLASLVGARLANTLIANRFFSGHPQDLGLCGSWAVPSSAEVIRDSDVVLVLGASLNDRTTSGRTAFGSARLLHCEVNIDQPCLASSPEFALLADAGETTRALIREWERRKLPTRPAPTPPPAWARRRSEIMRADIGWSQDRGLDPRAVFDHLDRTLPADRIIVTDGGRAVGAALPSLVDVRDARSWLATNSFGSIGRGLGTAVGAAVAQPGRRVVLFCGDGGFMMSSQDLDAVRLNDLDLTVMILNDNLYGAEVKYLARHRLPLDILEQELPDVPVLASAFGGQGHVVASLADLDALDLDGAGLTLIDVRIDPLANVWASVG